MSDDLSTGNSEIAALADRVATARGKLPLQHDSALVEVLSDAEIAAERELAEWVRAQRRAQRRRAVEDELTTEKRDRRTSAAIDRADADDARWHRKALAARRRVANQDARLAQLYRRAEWSSRALIGVVVLGMVWAGVNVQRNLVPSGDMSDPLYWLSYGIEAMISIPIITIMVVATTAARWGRELPRGKVVVFEAALLGTTVALNTGPHLAAGQWGRAAEFAIAPVMVGVVIWLHAWVAARYAQLIDSVPIEEETLAPAPRRPHAEPGSAAPDLRTPDPEPAGPPSIAPIALTPMSSPVHEISGADHHGDGSVRGSGSLDSVRIHVPAPGRTAAVRRNGSSSTAIRNGATTHNGHTTDGASPRTSENASPRNGHTTTLTRPDTAGDGDPRESATAPVDETSSPTAARYDVIDASPAHSAPVANGPCPGEATPTGREFAAHNAAESRPPDSGSEPHIPTPTTGSTAATTTRTGTDGHDGATATTETGPTPDTGRISESETGLTLAPSATTASGSGAPDGAGSATAHRAASDDPNVTDLTDPNTSGTTDRNSTRLIAPQGSGTTDPGGTRPTGSHNTGSAADRTPSFVPGDTAAPNAPASSGDDNTPPREHGSTVADRPSTDSAPAPSDGTGHGTPPRERDTAFTDADRFPRTHTTAPDVASWPVTRPFPGTLRTTVPHTRAATAPVLHSADVPDHVPHSPIPAQPRDITFARGRGSVTSLAFERAARLEARSAHPATLSRPAEDHSTAEGQRATEEFSTPVTVRAVAEVVENRVVVDPAANGNTTAGGREDVPLIPLSDLTDAPPAKAARRAAATAEQPAPATLARATRPASAETGTGTSADQLTLDADPGPEPRHPRITLDAIAAARDAVEEERAAFDDTEPDADGDVEIWSVARAITERRYSTLPVEQVAEILTLADQSWTPTGIAAEVAVSTSAVTRVLEAVAKVRRPAFG